MPFDLTIPQSTGDSLSFVIDAGECIFVLGANGTGKSSLMHSLYQAHPSNARRISAHRQTWFASNAITLSPSQKRDTETNIQNNDTNPRSRWMDDYSAQRASISIYDLIDAENVRARSIAGAVDADNIDLARTLSRKDAPLKIINELLRLSNIPIEISVRQNEEVVASKLGGRSYSIAELSDGERNALLIAANVLTVPPGTLLLIDEPERHLHRSIISPLLTRLFDKRPDCAFVISTHDVMLSLDNPGARTILVRGCAYSGNSIASWDADIIPTTSEIDESLKKDILGSRRKILFIEGDERSLDRPLYSLIFPNVSVVTKASCRDVEHAVSGIRGAADLHWVHAFGVVDNDRRTQSDIEELKAKGIYAVSVYSVESIYYHPEIQQRVVERAAVITGEDAVARLTTAKTAAINAVTAHKPRLSARVAEKLLRDQFDRHRPKQSDIVAGTPINITIDVKSAVDDELERLEAAISSQRLEEIISRYPIRETPALREIATNLGFQSRTQYENAVRKLIMDDQSALSFVKSLFGTLEQDIANA